MWLVKRPVGKLGHLISRGTLFLLTYSQQLQVEKLLQKSSYLILSLHFISLFPYKLPVKAFPFTKQV